MMPIEDVRELVAIMRENGVEAFKFGELEVQFGAPARSAFTDQQALAQIFDAVAEHDLSQPPVGTEDAFTDEDIFGSS